MDKKNKIWTSVICAVLLTVFIVAMVIKSCISDPPKDLNVYLNEDVCFADDVFIKVTGMSVTENISSEGEDEDGDILSNYILNLDLEIQRKSKKAKNKPIEINPKMFQLKSVNLKSKSKMAVFFESMFKATLSALASGSGEGEINIIEETIGFAEEYITNSIENAQTLKTDFKPISANKESFKSFSLDNQSDVVNIQLHFPIKQEYLESENVIVLAVDTWKDWEKRIFLIQRLQSI